jgi:hypothetical protein
MQNAALQDVKVGFVFKSSPIQCRTNAKKEKNQGGDGLFIQPGL